MRLIDADELKLDAQWDDYEDGFTAYSQIAIECAETVDAVPTSVIEEIKAECVRAVDRIPITFSKQDADNCLKKDIRDIFDKHIGKEQE